MDLFSGSAWIGRSIVPHSIGVCGGPRLLHSAASLVPSASAAYPGMSAPWITNTRQYIPISRTILPDLHFATKVFSF